jgi:hypothetical protein
MRKFIDPEGWLCGFDFGVVGPRCMNLIPEVNPRRLARPFFSISSFTVKTFSSLIPFRLVF